MENERTFPSITYVIDTVRLSDMEWDGNHAIKIPSKSSLDDIWCRDLLQMK